jgi:hypothetical protein
MPDSHAQPKILEIISRPVFAHSIVRTLCPYIDGRSGRDSNMGC